MVGFFLHFLVKCTQKGGNFCIFLLKLAEKEEKTDQVEGRWLSQLAPIFRRRRCATVSLVIIFHHFSIIFFIMFYCFSSCRWRD